MVADIQAVINSLPLQYVKGEITDVPTPNPFVDVTNSTPLFVTTIDDVLDLDFKPIDSITLFLSMRKMGQQRLDQFWSSWQYEYLLSLRESLHSQGEQKCTAINNTPSINDIVQIKENTPHGIWLGCITEVHISYDGQVCAGSVKTFLRRSISHLCPLELSQNRTPPAATDNRDNNVQPSITPRPKRNAAAISELRSHDVLMDASYMVTACQPH